MFRAPAAARLVRRTAPHLPKPTPRLLRPCQLALSAPSRRSSSTNTISPDEIAHFSALSAHWWDPTGEFGLLHRMNPARVQFMRDSLLRAEELPQARWLEGRNVLDVGCGGGIFAESLARLGADTLAIDASSSNISVAQTHASRDPAFNLVNSSIPPLPSGRETAQRNPLEYRHCAAEDLVREGRQFDVVCAMEVIEHVEDPRGFLDCLSQLTKVRSPSASDPPPAALTFSCSRSRLSKLHPSQPGGFLLLSTISRTPLAQFLTITMAESILRLVTPGTHTYHKYIKPDELQAFFDGKGWWGMERRGCVYDPLAGRWRLLGEGEFGGAGELVNYFAGVRKPL
ncbi:SPOSA6832_00528 [Sporobolomyces salmonicolor]|uniref:Ubiquinone biosynthesis O-methyltransferase, mitochondrial n=1 Tax=Sporidiobolus salmonicolor TaxID=5005 RepID=A0A0D6EHH4_SPOSA|nr:SPOSA6832_00528 [Sporobolomyces salmonicolor]